MIENRVDKSGLIVLDLKDHYLEGKRMSLDLAQYLFQGFVLREKEFRANLKDTDWSEYNGAFVAVHCSAEAIIPVWAYMLLASYLQEHATVIHYGTPEQLENHLFRIQLSKIDFSSYSGEKVVVKACGDDRIPTSAYLDVVKMLRPYAASIMYGEPCSTVPIFKKKAEANPNLIAQ